MRQATSVLLFETRRQGLMEITREVNAWVADTAMREGLLTLFCRHTSPPRMPTPMSMPTKVPTTCLRTCAPR
jgi:hypothetical protein